MNNIHIKIISRYALCASSLAERYLVYKGPTYFTHAISPYEAEDKNRSNDDQEIAKKLLSSKLFL